MSFKDTFDNNDYHRQIAISFSPFQSFAYDKGYDAEMFDIGATDFYWKFPELDNKFIITGVGTIENSLEVPLEIVMGYSGGVSIMIDEMKNVDQQVYINDKVTGVSYELIGGVANLNLEQGTYTDRFVLAFTPNEVLATDGILNAFTNMYLDNLNRNVVVTKTQDIDIESVALFNLLGKEVAAWIIEEQQDTNRLKINRKLPTGVYIIKVNSDKGQLNRKVVIE